MKSTYDISATTNVTQYTADKKLIALSFNIGRSFLQFFSVSHFSLSTKQKLYTHCKFTTKKTTLILVKIPQMFSRIQSLPSLNGLHRCSTNSGAFLSRIFLLQKQWYVTL